MKSEDVAQWYFRLNGFLTIPNFILHPPTRGSQRTDVDVVGLRFPNRREFGTEPGEIDDAEFSKSRSRLYVVLAEVKSRWVCLNDSWLDEARHNIEDVLCSLGVFSDDESGRAGKDIRARGAYENSTLYCSLFFIGDRLTDSASRLTGVPHRSWDAVLKFIYDRFSKYDQLKTQTDQWDEAGRTLLSLVSNRSPAAFTAEARRRFYLPAA